MTRRDRLHRLMRAYVTRAARSAVSLLSIGACALAVALLAGPLSPQATPPRVAPVPAHDTFTVASGALGESRRVNVHVPAGYRASPAARFPTLYMPDGGLDEDFPHVVNTADSLIALGAIRPVIVVGIPNTERRRDLTGPTRFAADSAIARHVGGSAAFRRHLVRVMTARCLRRAVERARSQT